MCVLVHVHVLADMPVSVTYITTILELFGWGQSLFLLCTCCVCSCIVVSTGPRTYYLAAAAAAAVNDQ